MRCSSKWSRMGAFIVLVIGMIIDIYIIEYCISDVQFPIERDDFLTTILILSWFVINLGLRIYAFIGVLKERPSYLLPHISLVSVVSIILALLLLLVWIWMLTYDLKDQFSEYHEFIGLLIQKIPIYEDDDLRFLSAFLLPIISLYVSVYLFFTFVVYDYYKKLRAGFPGLILTADQPDQQDRKILLLNDHSDPYSI